MVEVEIDHFQQKTGEETIWGWGQGWFEDEDVVHSWETGLKTIQLFKVMADQKGYYANATVYNKGQFDNYTVIHIYDLSTGTQVRAGSYHLEVDFAGE